MSVLDLNADRYRVLPAAATTYPGWASSTAMPKTSPYSSESFDAVINVESSHCRPPLRPVPQPRSRECCARAGRSSTPTCANRSKCDQWEADLNGRGNADRIGAGNQRRSVAGHGT